MVFIMLTRAMADKGSVRKMLNDKVETGEWKPDRGCPLALSGCSTVSNLYCTESDGRSQDDFSALERNIFRNFLKSFISTRKTWSIESAD